MSNLNCFRPKQIRARINLGDIGHPTNFKHVTHFNLSPNSKMTVFSNCIDLNQHNEISQEDVAVTVPPVLSESPLPPSRRRHSIAIPLYKKAAEQFSASFSRLNKTNRASITSFSDLRQTKTRSVA